MKPMIAMLAALLLAASARAAPAAPLVEFTLFDRTEGRQLPVHWHEGRAWVVGKPGNEYQIALRNRAGEEVLAVVSVDGVNVVSGETASAQQGGYVLSPWGALDIRGWRKSLQRTAAFYFTPLPDSYAARTGRPDHVGVVGVAVFRKKAPEPQALERIAPQAKARGDAAGASAESRSAPLEDRLGTGHGRQEDSPARYVAFERASSVPAQTLTLYYDSYRNLVARGVLPSLAVPRPLPRPFPGFVPDPGA